MQQIMSRVADILEKQLKVYGDLILISEELTDVILNGDIKKLDEILKDQQTMIMTMGRLENNRMKATNELWEDNLTLTDLIDKAEGDLGVRLEELLKQLIEKIEEQRRLNEINNKLLKTNLEYVEFTLGTVTKNQPINLFDQRA